MESLDGNMTQGALYKFQAELINLEMLQGLEYDESREREIERLKSEIEG